MKEVFNLKDLIIHILRKWRWMLCFAVVFAILLGGYKYVSGMNELNHPTTENEAQQEFQESKKTLKAEIKLLKKSSEVCREYYTNNDLLKIDAYNANVYHMSFIVKMNEGIDNSGLISNDIASAYVDMIMNSEVYNQIEVDDDKLNLCSDLISATSEGSLVSITAIIDGEDYTKKVAEQIYEGIQNGNIVVQGMSDSYTVQLVSQNTTKIDTSDTESIAALQSNIVMWGDRYQNAIDARQKKLDTLESENGYEEVTKSTVISDTVKFIIVGIFGGIIAGVLLGLFLDLMGNKLRDNREIDKTFALSSIGNPYMVADAKRRNPIDHFIDYVDGKKYESCKFEEKADYIAMNLKVLLEKKENINRVLFTGSLADEKSEELFRAIQSRFADNSYQFVYGKKITTTADTVQSAEQCDALILMEQVNKTIWKDIELEYELANQLEKEVLGYVLV